MRTVAEASAARLPRGLGAVARVARDPFNAGLGIAFLGNFNSCLRSYNGGSKCRL